MADCYRRPSMREIPLSLVPEADDPHSVQVFADGSIGPAPVRFLVDTGARTCLVPLTPATQDLPSLKRSTGTGAANVSPGDDEVVVPEIRVGDLVAHDVAADRADLDAVRHPLLGMNALGQHCCMFRLAAGLIELDACAPPASSVHTLDTDSLDTPFVTVTFDDLEIRACWDTGASRSAVDLGWAQRHPDLVVFGAPVTGHDSAGVELHVWEGTLAACSIGGVEFAASPCVVVDLGPLNSRFDQPIEVIIGVPIIRAAEWWFDFPNRQWAVQEI